MAHSTSEYLDTTCEILHENGEDVIRQHEVRIHFIAHPYQPETGPTYSCGGTPAEDAFCEFDGAEVLGNRGKWITLRPGDPLYWWADEYLTDNQDKFNEAASYDRGGDPDYWRDQMRDDRLMGLVDD